ncbi:hypothetical protein MBRA1_002178 [Malassezia brasiliensis]|uniref:Major facilitator superfamily (MFS) profile domain-containing protein n=1 Tax=Malassezia brasiliensis TaxID=1821822 RepID=A0AAF0DXS6_9BASI|nr:hypothetical protein MBRA1_002178 [Malassezia brasiliensis]
MVSQLFAKDPTHGLFHVPDKQERERLRAGAPLNPLKIFAMLNGIQWAWFLCGLFCWIMDSYDFFAVSMSVSKLVETFFHPTNEKDRSEKTSQVNYAIMLTLLLRSLGAVMFGVIADRFGRRWVLSINMLIVAAFSLGTALQPVKKAPVKQFFVETGQMLKEQWKMCIYAILIMTGFNFLSHASQDLYPVMLQKAKMLSADQSSVATIISNCGAITGGLIAGYLSQYIGRRLAMLTFIIFAGCMIPAWILPNSFSGLAAGGFFLQVGVQGAWGVIPVYLSEISPAAFRATFPGLAYQLGNMASSASSTIESRGGENILMDDPKHPGEKIADYATVSAILLACVVGYLTVLLVFGVERRGDEFQIDDHVEGTNAEEVLAQVEGQDIEAAHHVRDPDDYVKDLDAYEYEKGIHLSDDKSDEKKTPI